MKRCGVNPVNIKFALRGVVAAIQFGFSRYSHMEATEFLGFASEKLAVFEFGEIWVSLELDIVLFSIYFRSSAVPSVIGRVVTILEDTGREYIIYDDPATVSHVNSKKVVK